MGRRLERENCDLGMGEKFGDKDNMGEFLGVKSDSEEIK